MKMGPEALRYQTDHCGDQATFRPRAERGRSTGTIKMQLEEGKWKVLEDKW
jgi:hypothetical protein